VELLPVLDWHRGPVAGDASGPGSHISLITKVTRICNLRCPYCHEWADTKSVLEFETLANLIAKSMRAEKVKAVRFIWHGGEPLVRGREFYEKALFIQNQCRRNGLNTRNSLQTNGTLVDAEWARFFHDKQFDVGVSLDGPRELHDRQRPNVNGRGSWEQTMRAVRLFREFEVRFGALVVITDDSLRLGADTFFDFLIGSGIKSFAMLHLRPESRPNALYNPDRDYVATDRFNRFQERLFDLWFANDDPDVHIREFDSIMAMLLGGNASVCTLAGGCIGQHFGINVNGDVYHCDRYVSDQDYLLGNIVRDEWSDIFASDAITTLRERNRQRITSYAQCSYMPICHGGCPHDAYIDRRSTGGANPDCCGQASLIEHIRQRLSQCLNGTRIGAAYQTFAA
jgi:uncharacterized protein